LKGAYALVLQIPQVLNVDVGQLGALEFKSGMWVYIGSAMGEGSTSLEKRLQRHFSKDKTIFWHIDRILATGATASSAFWIESSEKIECLISDALSRSLKFLSGPKGFGSSDCRNGCESHLFHYKGSVNVIDSLREIFERLKMEYYFQECCNGVSIKW
jgi:Uri superfamily endonuclease